MHDQKWLASGGEERRREAIRVGVANRRTFGKNVGGRRSKLHNRDGSLTKLGQDVLDAREFGLSYRRIERRFGVRRTTAWRHCGRYGNLRDRTQQGFPGQDPIRGRLETGERQSASLAEVGGSEEL